MAEVCDICGKNELVLSEIIFNANYGSKHDGEHLILKVCGNCFDMLFSFALKGCEKL